MTSGTAVDTVPLWLTLLSIFGATIAGGLITALTSWLLQKGQAKADRERFDRETERATTRFEEESARDHARWLREQRYEAYRTFMVESDILGLGLHRNAETSFEFTAKDYEDLLQAVNRIGLAGPHDLYLLAVDYQNVVHEELRIEAARTINWGAVTTARSKVGRRMQEILAVPADERMGLSPERTAPKEE